VRPVAKKKRILYHYTTTVGRKAIVSSKKLRPSLKARHRKDIRFGEGQYLSDIVPGTRTPGQLSYLFLNDPRGWRRFTDYVAIDVTGLTVVQGRVGVFLIPNKVDLELKGRVVDHGEVMAPKETEEGA
jgi:hypothetical protein